MKLKHPLKTVILFSFFLILHFESIGQVYFKTNDFLSTAKDLKIVGDAKFTEKVLRISPAISNQKGACWYKNQLDLSKGFETEFSFRIWGNDIKEQGGDGFAFVIQSLGDNQLGNAGDDIGYKTIPRGVVFEFDTHKDADDYKKNQVAMMEYNGNTKTYFREATVHEIPEISDGSEHFARIEYKEGRLIFYLDSYIFPVLSSKIDLSSLIGNTKAWIGFTSSTGSAFSNHDIISWNIKETVPKPTEIDVKKVEISNKTLIKVKSRKLIIGVLDHNRIDGDVISLKINNDWHLNKYYLQATPRILDFTLTGFNAELVVYANNLGSEPPNTCSITIDDGITKQVVKLEADMKKSEAITLQFEE
jgi:Legume lectin domain